MKKFALLLCTAALIPTGAYAQSTGTTATEEIVVTGTRTRQVGGVQTPDTTKATVSVTKELIERQASGQTILNAINLVPGVNFTNSDSYGSSGGNIRIRGFDGNRISLTFDGVPLNDSGNYAIYSNQQLDGELIEQVNVNLGATDVDSPTASAAGGTINYRTILPTEQMGVRFAGSLGSFDYRRAFAMINTGNLTSSGTRAWFSASTAKNDKFKGPGGIDKWQINGRIYQPIGNGRDFISLAAHYNENRNNFYRNPSVNDLRTLFGPTEISPAAAATSDNPIRVGYFDGSQEDSIFDFENDDTCIRPAGGPGAQVESTTLTGSTPICTNYYNVRINPSNTGNIRGSSRFTLAPGLILTADPSYQYTLANGGGISVLSENSTRTRGAAVTSTGVDYNGDGDTADRLQFYTPNTTNTNRIGFTSSLIWDVNPQHRVRVAYTYDRAKHRQTGEWGFLEANGDPENVFGGRNGRPVLDASGFTIQQRDRTSIALLNQISGQYIGKFFDSRLRVEAGVRRPFFKRELDQNCYTEARGSGFAYCTSEPVASLRIIAPDAIVPSTGATPYYAPFEATYKFGKLLPNIGFTYQVNGPVSVFGSYAKGFSAPRTDNLYRAPNVEVVPEQTNSFDLGVRYSSSRIQAQATAWKIDYSDRIVTSFNQELGISIDRNVGKVKSHGFDASVAVRPIAPLALIGMVSYIDTELQNNIQLGTVTFPVVTAPAGLVLCDGAPTAGAPVAQTCAPTAGKFVTETPKWQFGARAQYEVGPLSLGIQAKRVGSRFATDVNDVKVKGYTLVDLDARLSMKDLGMTGLEKSYIQLNVQNLFDTFYLGNISTQIAASNNPNFSVGSPRTISATLNVGF